MTLKAVAFCFVMTILAVVVGNIGTVMLLSAMAPR